MKRREFVASVVATGLAAPALASQGHGSHRPLEGPLATATVSFGAWPSHPPLDRTNLPPGPPPNLHEQIPYMASIKAGGTVNFIIAGVHQLAVYAPGTALADVNGSLLQEVPGAPPGFPPVVNDATNRVYRGPFPSLADQDRVEVVHFTTPGTYLTVCVFLPHFLEGMHGWVRVLP